MSSSSKPERINKGVSRGKQIEFEMDGQTIRACEGETIAAALINAGLMISGTLDDRPRGVFCNIGVCHSCVMTVNGVTNVRICRTPVQEGCRVESGMFNKGGWDD